MSVSVAGISKNRCRTTVAEPIGETRAELPFTGYQVGLFRAQPGRPNGGASLRRFGFRVFAQDQVRRGWSKIIAIFQWVLIFEQSVNHRRGPRWWPQIGAAAEDVQQNERNRDDEQTGRRFRELETVFGERPPSLGCGRGCALVHGSNVRRAGCAYGPRLRAKRARAGND